MKYPKYVKVNGVKHEINTDYRIALKCFDIINDPNISDVERTYAIVYKLFGFIPEDEDIAEYIRLSELYLGCGETQETQQGRKRDIDFKLDWKYLVASFMSDYQIDLNNCKMHWYQFIDLIQGFTEDTVMSRVRELRNYDLSEIKDQKTKDKIIKAQENVALPVEFTEEEQMMIDKFESLF